jgi:hypothetical protein
VELMFGVVDAEMRRIQMLFNSLEDSNDIEFEDLLGLAVSVAVQRMRTPQQRRLRQQHAYWLSEQIPDQFSTLDDDEHNPHRAAGIHTEMLFKGMWEAADVFASRQIEIWHDTKGRFVTCDTPVLVPFTSGVRPGLLSAPAVLWPVSPFRVVALTNDLVGEKAAFRMAKRQHVDLVRDSAYMGRERMVFASADQRRRLGPSTLFNRRAQVRLRCSTVSPSGLPIEPPGCCIEMTECFGAGPDVRLCAQGLHKPAPAMSAYA